MGEDDRLVVAGIDGRSGRYLVPPLSPDDLAAATVRLPEDDQQIEELRQRAAGLQPSFAIVHGPNPERLDEAGWGVVAAQDTPADVLAALQPLLDHRSREAGARFRAFTGEDGYGRGESKVKFLARHGMGTGSADPERVPYYLLLVGGPESIPFQFQHSLDIQYAVGRVAFDGAGDYGHYAQRVVEAESAGSVPAATLSLFAPRSPGDDATRLSATKLVAPLAEALRRASDWDVGAVVEGEATKSELVDLLWGRAAPDVLFTAGHGMGLAHDDPLHRDVQGALVCSDWPGPTRHAEIEPDWYVAGSDAPAEVRGSASIVFSFACFGAGTPDTDDYAHLPGPRTAAIGPEPFVARLPQRLLGHPSGGPLAFVGHVERAWTYSFIAPDAGTQLNVFQSAIHGLLDGLRVGHALEHFGSRYSELAAELTTTLYRRDTFGEQIADARAFAGMWTAHNDARGYVLYGDPAVRARAAAAVNTA